MSLLMIGLVESVGLVIVPSVVFHIIEYIRKSHDVRLTEYRSWRG
jgi:hypothetical protein